MSQKVFKKRSYRDALTGGRTSPAQLLSSTPYVYVPWTCDSDPVIFEENYGSADEARPYIHLLSSPDTLLFPNLPLSQHESWALVRIPKLLHTFMSLSLLPCQSSNSDARFRS